MSVVISINSEKFLYEDSTTADNLHTSFQIHARNELIYFRDGTTICYVWELDNKKFEIITLLIDSSIKSSICIDFEDYIKI